MKTVSSEYFPAEREKAFDIVPHKDAGWIIVQARRDVRRDGDLDFGARLLFCELLDLALNSATWKRRGSVTVSTTKLSELLQCGKTSIYDWNADLVSHGYIWVTSQPMPNFWDMNTYHITALDPRNGNDAQTLAGDGLWGNGARRGKSPKMGFGVRNLNAESTHEQVSTPQISSKNEENAPGTCAKTDRSHSESEPGAFGIRTGGIRNPNRGGSESEPGAFGKPHAAHSENRTSPVRESAVYKKSIDRRSRDQSGGEGRPTPQKTTPKTQEDELQAWRQSLNGLFPSKLEKIMVRLVQDRDKATAPNVRQFIGRKIKMLKELLDGPTPAPEEPATPHPLTSRTRAIAQREPTAEELLESARYLVENGKGDLLTEAQKRALAGSNAK